MRAPSSAKTSKITPCCSKVEIKRGPWTPEEDEILANFVQKEGPGRWRTLPKRAGLQRCGKSCRLRWMNYLRPSVKRGHIAPDEEDLILRLHRLLGNRWSLIAGRIPGRTDNEIKNYWNTHLSKKLISQGIDPRTHKPLIIEDNNIPNLQRTSNTHAIPQTNSTTTTPPPVVQSHRNNYQTNAIDHNISTGKQQNQNMEVDRNEGPCCENVMGMGPVELKHDDDNNNIGGQEDSFSLFLDSLMNNDGGVGNIHQQIMQDDMLSPMQSFNLAAFWERETAEKCPMDNLWDDHHHQYYGSTNRSM